jgi:ribose-phosphate pyrophosphokinase
MIPVIVSGSANEALALAMAARLGRVPLRRTLRRFPDGEIELRLDESVRGNDVYIVQSTCPPVDGTINELLLLADASRLAGAKRVTAVVPYFGYARQDRRVHGREPLAARLIGRCLAAAGVDRLITVDLHSAALESAFPFPVEHLTAVPLLADALKPGASERGVVVAPDLGAVKLAERYARALELPVAVVHKERLSGSEVKAIRVIGEVADREPIVVDDMIVTGATIVAAIGAVRAAGARPNTVVAASHLVLAGNAAARLTACAPCRLLGTDSVPRKMETEAMVTGLADLLSQAIYSLHCDQAITEIGSHA